MIYKETMQKEPLLLETKNRVNRNSVLNTKIEAWSSEARVCGCQSGSFLSEARSFFWNIVRVLISDRPLI